MISDFHLYFISIQQILAVDCL